MSAKKYAFLSAPYVAGSGADPGPAHIPAEESLGKVISNVWVNEEYKHLIITASPKALSVKPGQFFNILCPSPDDGELWLRRPQSIYRVDRANKRLEFLYKCVGRGTRQRTQALAAAGQNLAQGLAHPRIPEHADMRGGAGHRRLRRLGGEGAGDLVGHAHQALAAHGAYRTRSGCV